MTEEDIHVVKAVGYRHWKDFDGVVHTERLVVGYTGDGCLRAFIRDDYTIEYPDDCKFIPRHVTDIQELSYSEILEILATNRLNLSPVQEKTMRTDGKPKFTPGPWHKKGKRVFWQKPEPDLPKDNLFNGLVCICATTEDNPPEVVEEACANAALIAQAPKMLNTLRKCLEFLRRCPMTRNAELEGEIETTLKEATK